MTDSFNEILNRVLFLTTPLVVLTICLGSLCGVIIFANYAGCDPLSLGMIARSDQIAPHFVLEYLSSIPGFVGLFIATLFSGALSSLSSGINSMAAVFGKSSSSHSNSNNDSYPVIWTPVVSMYLFIVMYLLWLLCIVEDVLRLYPGFNGYSDIKQGFLTKITGISFFLCLLNLSPEQLVPRGEEDTYLMTRNCTWVFALIHACISFSQSRCRFSLRCHHHHDGLRGEEFGRRVAGNYRREWIHRRSSLGHICPWNFGPVYKQACKCGRIRHFSSKVWEM